MALQRPQTPARAGGRPGLARGDASFQDDGLSPLARTLDAHIRSLPGGAHVSARGLARRFPDGRHNIAAALDELESYGHLERSQVRLPSGQLVTRALSYVVTRHRGDGPDPGPPDGSPLDAA
ncbi:hypothetical protein [Streptomyces sp. NPDC090022]|uniref:hypothetical protein n=1 Tax=Streptomyces sp. NPDC090022 TaxID=3365920 RepID=UPI00380F478D